MWRMGTVSSRLDIHLLGLSQDLVAEVLAQRVHGVQVDPPAQDLRQLILHAREREARRTTRLKLDQHVNVAIRREVVAQDRTEEGEPANVVTAAEVAKLV